MLHPKIIVEDVTLIAGGTVEMQYDEVSGATLHSDFVGILPDGKKCAPQHDPTLPDGAEYCDQCVGVAYASKKDRWIFRCGGKAASVCKYLSIISCRS